MMRKKTLYTTLIALFITVFMVSGSTGVFAASDPTIPQIQPEVQEKSYGKITNIEIKGNVRVDKSSILKVVEAKVGDQLTDSLLQKTYDAVSNLGYFWRVIPDAAPFLGGIKFIITVEELPLLKDLEFSGNTLVESSTLLKAFDSQKSKIINVNTIAQTVSEAYEKAGYLIYSYVSGITPDGVVAVDIIELKVSEVGISGNQKTKSEVITSGITLKPGDFLSVKAIQEDLRAIYNTGAFEEPKPIIEMDQENFGYCTVVYELTDAKTNIANIGITYSGEEKLMGYAEIGSKNLLGRLESLSLKGSFGKNQIQYEISLNLPWLFNSKNSLSLSASNTDKQVLTSSIRMPDENGIEKSVTFDLMEAVKGFEATYTRRLTQNAGVSLGYSFYDKKSSIKGDVDGSITNHINDTDTLSDEEKKELLYSTKTGTITLGGYIDFTDNQIATTKGITISTNLQIANKFLGGDQNYVKLYNTVKAYQPLFNKDVLAIRASYYTSLGKNSLPIGEKFRLGGSESLRGYDASQFLGDSVAFVNIENRYTITDSFHVIAFCDIGYAWDKYNTNGVTNTRLPENVLIGYGLGLRVNVPMFGLMRLDYGINREGKGKVYFSFGQMF